MTSPMKNLVTATTPAFLLTGVLLGSLAGAEVVPAGMQPVVPPTTGPTPATNPATQPTSQPASQPELTMPTSGIRG